MVAYPLCVSIPNSQHLAAIQAHAYIQTTDERFRILNGAYFEKGNTLIFHCSPPFGNGFGGLDDAEVVGEAMDTLRGMYGADSVPSAPAWSLVTRWDKDPFSMGAYSFWRTGMELKHVKDVADPEPPMQPRPEAAGAGGSTGATNLVSPRLFFCGEHTTVRDAQCVHGACNSGERAARQLAAASFGFLPDLERCVAGGEDFWDQEFAGVGLEGASSVDPSAVATLTGHEVVTISPRDGILRVDECSAAYV